MCIQKRRIIALIIAIASSLSRDADAALQERRPRKESPEKQTATPKARRSVLGASGADEPAPKKFIPLRSFAFNHIWGGRTGYRADPPYRAKVSLWGADPYEVAELYFYDDAARMPENPGSNHPNFQPGDKEGKYPYYVLSFPMTTLGPILEQLRRSPVKLSLNYYDGEWAIFAEPTESVVSPVPPFAMRKKKR